MVTEQKYLPAIGDVNQIELIPDLKDVIKRTHKNLLWRDVYSRSSVYLLCSIRL